MRDKVETEESNERTTENSKPPPPLKDLAEIEESDVHTGDRKLLYPNFPANTRLGLYVRKPEPYKETVDVPTMGIFLGDDDERITAGTVKKFPSDCATTNVEIETEIERSMNRELVPLAAFKKTKESLVHR